MSNNLQLMIDDLSFKSFKEEIPEDGQKIVYKMGDMPGATMCTFRCELARKDVFNYLAILRLDSGAYVIQLLPENIDQFKWSPINE